MLIKKHRLILFICCAFGAAMFTNCRKQSTTEVTIYSNDFESGDIKNITNGAIDIYNGNHVLGRYNKSFFELNIDNLPKHSLIKVTFDLYIHDSWDGNASYGDNVVGPDIWTMSIDSSVYMNTTFANELGGAGSLYPPQSYPNAYLANNYPRTGAYSVLPGACSLSNLSNGSSLYKIEKNIEHTNSKFTLRCVDQLKQLNVVDQKCDESWSIDNLKITAVQ